MAIEPSEEAVLRVKRTKTALVLGGSVPSALPPDLLISGSNDFVPLQGDTVKILASILAPPLCPSVLSLKFRVAVLLHGLPGLFLTLYDLLLAFGIQYEDVTSLIDHAISFCSRKHVKI